MAVLVSSSVCSLEPLVQSIEFKSGALYTGNVTEGKMSGRGTFRWPSGLRYTGEYADNKRQGYGEQEWREGSRYEGEFWEDLRQGWGRHSWSNGETYEGEYVRDKKHGRGSYAWPSGAKFSGQFESDQKEGLGVFISPEGEKFEGMYHGDIRDGEGVMTYPSGRQDVGVWRGEKLVQLKFVVPAATFNPYSAHPLGSAHSLDTPDTKSRGKYGPKGPLEVGSEELLEAAAVGDSTRVEAILKGEGLYVDVKDMNGHSALFAAALHCHPSILHLLLDHGADVNQLDMAGVSPLTACHHLLYGSTPRAQELLKRLPASCYSTLTNSSSPASEYTMHTSDFLSTPPNTPYSIQDTAAGLMGCPTPKASQQLPPSFSLPLDLRRDCIECSGLCKAKSATVLLSQASKFRAQASDDLRAERKSITNSLDQGLGKVQSYPLLDGRSRKKVRFTSMETLLPGQQRERQWSRVAAPDICCDQERSDAKGNLPGSKPKNALLQSWKTNLTVSRADDGDSGKKEKSILPAFQYSVNAVMPSRSDASAHVSDERASVARPPSLGRDGSNPTSYEDTWRNTDANSRDEFLAINSHVSHKSSQENGVTDGSIDQPLRSWSRESHDLPSESDGSDSEVGDCSSSESDTREESCSPCNRVDKIWPPSSEESQHGDVSSGLNGLSLQSKSQPKLSESLSSTPSISLSNGRPPHLSNAHMPKTKSQNSSHLQVPTSDPTPSSSHFPLKETARRLYLSAPVESELHSSSVFSSTRYGPIVSAAQSITLSCGGSDRLEELSEPSSSPSPGSRDEEEVSLSHTPDSSIFLLLQRGAEPDISSFPLPPLFYAMVGGDSRAMRRLLERGASTSQRLPPELGSLTPLHAAVTLPGTNSPAIVEALLQYGADPNCGEGERLGVGLENSSRERREGEDGSLTPQSDVQSDSEDAKEHNGGSSSGGTGNTGAGEEGSEEVQLAGDNPGITGLTPLHLACGREAAEVASEVVSAVVEVLLSHGAEVNRVAKGHSPLSLAILSGHDSVVNYLLMKGADPNFPLGRGVATALCSLTTHTAHKRRNSKATFMMVRKLLEHGADVLQPVKVRDEWGLGTVVDFSHEAFKQDKRLSTMKYSALSKSERVCYKAARRVIQHFINLLRCKALESITKESSPHPMSKHLYRTMSAAEPKSFNSRLPGRTHNQKATFRRDTQSAGAVPRRGGNITSFSLPERTLRAALDDINKIHGDPSHSRNTVNSKLRNYSTRGPSTLFSGAAITCKIPTSQILRFHPESEPSKLEKDGKLPPLESGNRISDTALPNKRGEWTLSSFCYECGRRAGVHLSKCHGCGSVYYCSQTCREEGFKRGHKEECTGAQVRTDSLSKRKPQKLLTTVSKRKKAPQKNESVKTVSLKAQSKAKTHRKVGVKTE